MAAAIAFASFLSLAVVALVMRMAYLTEERNGRALQARIAELEDECRKLYDLSATQQQLIHGWSTAAEAWRSAAVHLLGVVNPAAADTAKRAIAQADTRALLRRAGVAGSTAR